jgi:hypothetical protein
MPRSSKIAKHIISKSKLNLTKQIVKSTNSTSSINSSIDQRNSQSNAQYSHNSLLTIQPSKPSIVNSITEGISSGFGSGLGINLARNLFDNSTNYNYNTHNTKEIDYSSKNLNSEETKDKINLDSSDSKIKLDTNRTDMEYKSNDDLIDSNDFDDEWISEDSYDYE